MQVGNVVDTDGEKMLTEVFYLHEKDLCGCKTLYLYTDDSDSIAIEKRPMMLICPGGGYEHTSDREAEPLAMHFLSIGYHGSAALFGGTGSLSDGPVRGNGVHEADS